jgi:hypothetical protein
MIAISHGRTAAAETEQLAATALLHLLVAAIDFFSRTVEDVVKRCLHFS